MLYYIILNIKLYHIMLYYIIYYILYIISYDIYIYISISTIHPGSTSPSPVRSLKAVRIKAHSRAITARSCDGIPWGKTGKPNELHTFMVNFQRAISLPTGN